MYSSKLFTLTSSSRILLRSQKQRFYSTSTEKPKLTLSDISYPTAKVFLYAFFTYSFLHAVMWNLKVEESEAEWREKTDLLEKKIYEKADEIKSILNKK